MALAELEAALTSARRDCARVKDNAELIKTENKSLAEERDKAWEEVCCCMLVTAR